VTTSEPARLRRLRHRLGAAQRVAEVAPPPQGWIFDDEGVLRHERTDFFHVMGAELADGTRSVLLGQPEEALVGLVVARRDGLRHALLTARCEPGLHDGCQFSSTVQSTPSNYRRLHGGAATTHLDLVLDPPAGARIMHDSRQFDWGQYYLGKTKRFVIVEIDDLLDTAEPHVWVDEHELAALMVSDFAITSDLRGALAMLLAEDSGLEVAHADAAKLDAARARTATERLRRCDLRDVAGWDAAVGSSTAPGAPPPTSVRGVHVVSESREVAQWCQPLLAVAEPLVTQLPMRGVGTERRFAIERRTASGLLGVELWYPVDTAASASLAIRTSAEGGRFLRHEVVVAVAVDPAAPMAPGATWVSLAELLALCAMSQTTAVELRLALSLVLSLALVAEATA
jgi:oxidase EvaA